MILSKLLTTSNDFTISFFFLVIVVLFMSWPFHSHFIKGFFSWSCDVVFDELWSCELVILCFLNHDMFLELWSCVSWIMILSKLLTTSNDFTVSFCFLGVCCPVYVMTIPFTFYQRFHFLILWCCVWWIVILWTCDLVFLESWYVSWIVILCFLNYDPVQALNNVERFYYQFFFLGVCCAIYVMTIPFTYYQRFHFLILWCCVWWIVILWTCVSWIMICFLNCDLVFLELWSCPNS